MTLERTIEALIDQHGLVTVLGALSTVCGEKAMHVAETWQDASQAKLWDQCAHIIAAAALRIEKRDPPRWFSAGPPRRQNDGVE